MSKHNSLTKKIKKQILSINVSIESYFNRIITSLKNIKKAEFINNNKVILVTGALVILTLSYFLIPTIYDKQKLSQKIENQILAKYNFEIKINNKVTYALLPKPHLVTRDVAILHNKKKIADVKNFKIFISINNLFSFKSFEIKDLILDKTEFNLNISSVNFFRELLNLEPSKNKILIKNSNIFFKNKDDEVLFINKIFDSKFYYDSNNLENLLISKNKVFNIPYKLLIKSNKFKKLRLNIKNEINYNDLEKNGLLEILFINKSTNLTYKINKNSLSYVSEDIKNNYKGIIDFKPFYISSDFIYQGLNFRNLFNPDSLLIDIINSEIFRNKNLNANINLDVKDITNINELKNLELRLNIQEGDISFSNSKIMWKNDVKISLSESLLNYDKNQIYLTGKLNFSFADLDNFYRSFQVKKNNRKKLSLIEIDFMYDLNQNKINVDNVKIDNKSNSEIDEYLENFNKSGGKIFNKVTFKNFINNFFSIYAG